MKKLFLSILLSFLLTSSAMAAGTKPIVVNLTLTSANTEYSLSIPNGSQTLTIQSRTAVDFKMATTALASGSTYFTVKSGTAYYETTVNAYKDVTLYFQSTSAGQVLEITYWQ